ncbi:aldo/keto reductase [Glycomyces algeriensis]|uniref:Oxidoreductase n=1 Tax=Glycomyces algeriensis TaxID=256037 RepID=A0A9W6LGQ5_9ACTN|nr:aldo/keto reductase [Glycomyces algeriensis]MDA1364499.1 aldo/keto reductase [Glycomyces algeriensis]MDR7350534.1 aryl-alcohol dehydrogenase-like predicted oxidoreductase [Glycomyces algeriensis]GLI43242.1 oxidoreductase [Glycomyces algeriensis]
MRRHQIGGTTGFEASQFCLGTMYFGTTVGEDEAFAILDRYAEAGGNLLDTANCYAFWADGGTGEESEALIGRWLAARDAAGTMRVATKVGSAPARPDEPYHGGNREGLSPERIAEQFERSRERLGVESVALYYAHADDREVPLDETVDAFARLVEKGSVGVLGASNHASWRLERARASAARAGREGYRAIQQRHTYLYPRPLNVPVPESIQLAASDELLDYAVAEDLPVFAYSPLSNGAFSRSDRRPPGAPVDYDHAGSERRVAVLREEAAALGVTPNQLALAWLTSGPATVIPILGVSSVSQLDEALAGSGIELDAAVRDRLTAA